MADKLENDNSTLTDYERELLVCIMEECAEVIQAASKVYRFGKGGCPENVIPNTVTLSGEIGDLMEVLNRAAKVNLIDFTDVDFATVKKGAKLDKYLQYRPDGSTSEGSGGPTAVTYDEAGRAVASRPDVAGIEARAKSATQGELIGGHYSSIVGCPLVRAHSDGQMLANFYGSKIQAEMNAHFFDKARQDIPDLITYIGRLEARQMKLGAVAKKARLLTGSGAD